MDDCKFEELKHSGKLPSPSSVGMKILVLTQDEECSMDDVVEAIRTDPALTGRVIKLATSAQLASSAHITTVKEAAMRLGLRSVCDIALGFTLVSGNRTGKCPSFDYDRFWSFSIANAVAAETIAQELKLGSAPEFFTFGLLIGIGRLALASVHPETYDNVIRRARANPKLEMTELENEHLFINHRQVAGALFEEWGLPTFFTEVALNFDGRTFRGEFGYRETAPALKVLNAANVMAQVCVTDPERQPHLWPGLRRICEGLGTKSNRIAQIFDLVAPKWAEWGSIMHIPTNEVPRADELERRSAEDANETDKPRAATKSPNALRVLAVDDDPVSLRLLVALLKRDGHDVLTARDGKEALAVYLEHGAEMVITDWMMPEMDGIMLCRQLRRTDEGRKLYLLILTGRKEEDRIVAAFEAGVDDYIVKPFKAELLRARIKPALRVIRLQEDNDRQVAEKERLNRQLDLEKRKFRDAAMTDALTELPNRRYAMGRLEKEWSNCQRTGNLFSVIMIDIDFFKRVNDTWGHDVGDEVLQSTAKSIQTVLRSGDFCARMGGEEFLVVCPSTDSADGSLRVAERIRLAVAENQIKTAEFEGHVTISLGVAVTSDTVKSIDELLKLADTAVYEAKHTGRNKAVVAPPPGSDRRSA